MEELIEVLKNEKIEYEFGIIKEGYFCKIPDKYFKRDVIKIKAKENYIPKLVKKIEDYNIVLTNKNENKYFTVFTIQDNIKLLIEHVINSHILIPAVLLRGFIDDDKKLYYIDGETGKLSKSSAKKYNTKIGYYSKWFETYLSDKYEKKIGQIKAKIENFMYNKLEKVEFGNLYNDIDLLYKMSLFRNPEFVEEVNKYSLTSIFIEGGYSTEQIAYFFENNDSKLFEDNKIFIAINLTDEGFIMSNNIFSDIIISKGYKSMMISLHPKYAIFIVPKEYYDKKQKEYGEDSYMVINDIEVLRDVNKCIAKQNIAKKVNLIGRKSDLLNSL